MKLTRKQLGRIICEELSGYTRLREAAESDGMPEVAGEIERMLAQWKRDPSSENYDELGTQIDEDDPEAAALLRNIWKAAGADTIFGPDDSEGRTSQTIGDTLPWSSATLVAALRATRSGIPDAIAHNEYMTSAHANRVNWFKGQVEDPAPELNEPSRRGNVFKDLIAMRAGDEYSPKEGDLACAGRSGSRGADFLTLGTRRVPSHCDVCLDNGCRNVAGGNIDRIPGSSKTFDGTLGKRPRPDNIEMYITSEPEPFKDLTNLDKGDFLDDRSMPDDVKRSIEEEGEEEQAAVDQEFEDLSESISLIRQFVRCEIARK